MDINKFQSGGGFGMLFSAVANPYAHAQQQPQASSSTSSSSDSDILSKDVLNALRKEGLPNEVENFEYKLANLQKRISMGLPVNSQTLASIRSDANRIIKQSKFLDNAFEMANKNGTFGDVAIDPNGYIYAYTKEGTVKKVRFNEFDNKKYQALSYSELIEYRRNAPDAIDNSDMIQAIGQSVGIEKINKFIQDILTKVGTSENKQEAYESLKYLIGNAKAGQLTQEKYAALRAVASAADQVGLDTIFKTGEYSKNSNVQQALEYLLKIMPKNMVAQLEGNYIAQGGNYKSAGKHAYDIISTAVLASSNSSFQYNINFEQGINTAAGTSAGNSLSSKTYNKTPLEVFFDGNLNRTDINLSDPTDKNKTVLVGKGNTLGVLTNDNGNAVTHLPLSVALDQSVSKYLDKQHVYIGDQETTIDNLQNVAYGTDEIAQVMMPVLNDGSIDWQGVHAYAIAEERCKQAGITDPKQKNEIHALAGSNIRFNDDGSIQQTDNVVPYFLTYGYTVEKNAGDTKYKIELTGDREKIADDLIKSVYNTKDAKALGIEGMSGKHRLSDIVKVPVFIKISPTAASDARIYADHGPIEQNNHSEEEYMLRQQLFQQPVTAENGLNASSQLLYTTN